MSERPIAGLGTREPGAPASNGKPLLSLSLDLDNLWAYMKIHGDAGWEGYPSYLDRLVPIALERLERHGLKITFVIVGQDAVLERNRTALRSIAEAGHEIANHSFRHESWLHLYSRGELEEEIATAERAIEDATGRRPRGFRGPGFSLSEETLRVLSERGYLYDASTLPTFLGPLARAYYFMKSKEMTEAERKKRAKLFGSFSDGLRPIRPYRWILGEETLLEIPVTTMPFFRLPIHLSYQIYLSRFSGPLQRLYLSLAAGLCRASRVQPSFLLHPLDFLGADRLSELSFFPGMDLSTERKLDLFDQVITRLRKGFTLVSMEAHAAALAEAPLPTRRFVG